MKLFSTTIDGLQKNLDMRLKRQAFISSNIANAETPGYRPVDLKFTEELKRFLNTSEEPMLTTCGNHVGGEVETSEMRGEVIRQAGELSPDQNSVDLDRQMAELSSNAFNYRASVKMIHKKLALLKYVINGAR